MTVKEEEFQRERWKLAKAEQRKKQHLEDCAKGKHVPINGDIVKDPKTGKWLSWTIKCRWCGMVFEKFIAEAA